MNWHARISPNLIIIAVCARPYVTAAAQAGYKIAAFDIFNDVETRRLSFISEQVRFFNGGFDADDLWRKLNAVDGSNAVVVYGSGLEGQPEVLKKIARRFLLTGNSPEVVALVKDPYRFFALLDELEIHYPETRLDIPLEAHGWLAKKSGGSGGTHIRFYDGQQRGDYYQRQAEGMPVSVLFIADGKRIEVVGYNEQWLAPSSDMPYRYGGIVSNVVLPPNVKMAMKEAAAKVTAKIELRGLNSMDFLMTNDAVLALEINPRLSASFELYAISELFERHLQACRSELKPLPQHPLGSKAALVYYAGRDFDVGEFEWPAWTVDQPVTGMTCRIGDPVCTVIAQAHDAEAAKTLVFARASELDAQLRTLQKHSGK